MKKPQDGNREDVHVVAKPSDIRVFAEGWIRAWNVRDVESVLTHYADEVVFTSPTALRLFPASGGTVRGKAELREYWTSALGKNPGLHFDLLALYEGVDTIVLLYQNQAGATVSEVLTFRDGLIISGHAAHAVDRV